MVYAPPPIRGGGRSGEVVGWRRRPAVRPTRRRQSLCETLIGGCGRGEGGGGEGGGSLSFHTLSLMIQVVQRHLQDSEVRQLSLRSREFEASLEAVILQGGGAQTGEVGGARTGEVGGLTRIKGKRI